MFDDIKIVYPLVEQWSSSPIVAAGTTASINRGEPTKLGTSGAVAIMVDGDGTTGTVFTGIGKSASNETASVAGTVVLWLPLPGIIYSGAAKTASAADTQAEIDALYGKKVIFDLTASVWTVDTGASNVSTNCLIIIGGDYNTSTIFFAYATPGALIS